jgi:hypothetical protein
MVILYGVRLAGGGELSYFIDSMMKIKQKMYMLFIAIASFGGLVALNPTTVYAEVTGNKSCGVDTSIISCPDDTDNASDDTSKTAIWGLLTLVIQILTGGIGVLAIAGIVYGSILYTTAAGSAEQVKKAIEVFRNVVIGIVAYALMFGFLNFLIPGGVFG